MCLAAALTAAVALLASLAANAATAHDRWPGVLDALRADPWPWVGGLGAAAVVSAVTGVLAGGGAPATAGDPPPPGAPAVPSWVVDRAECRRAAAAVCRRRAGAVGLTTALEGAGGFGKTTLATRVCADRRVRRRFRGRVYVVTVGRDVRGRSAVAAKVGEVTAFVTGDTSVFEDPDRAGDHLGRLLDHRPHPDRAGRRMGAGTARAVPAGRPERRTAGDHAGARSPARRGGAVRGGWRRGAAPGQVPTQSAVGSCPSACFISG
ncbi:hypothetical protein AMK11_35670 [Streptomyces sp. CB02414]|nr:hypothetical protein AMK11_35670 [Streptomyces sp. CB02414]